MSSRNNSGPLPVLFDVAELGSHSHAGARGVRRVVENLARGLARDPKIDVRWTGISRHDREELAAAVGDDKCHATYYSHRLPLVDEAGKFFWQSAAWTAEQKLRPTGIPGVFGTLARTIDKLSRNIPRTAFREARVFHSPFRPLPSESKSDDFPLPFLTVYDIIPLLRPELVTPLSIQIVGSIARSIHSRAWLTCISQTVKDDICNYLNFPPERAFVTPLAASPEIFRRAELEEGKEVRRRYGISEAPYILSLCEIEPRKNVEHMVESVLLMLRRHPMKDLQLVFVGKYIARSLQLLALRAKLACFGKRAIFTGFVPNQDLAGLYSGATAFAFPSLAEGFGLPPLEAMQCGIPVVCSNTTSLPEVVGDAGFLLDPNDKEAWSDAFQRLITSEELRRIFSTRALKRAQLFTWEKTLRAVVAGYEFAVANHP